MENFRFGELRERTLHKQLKALYRPTDGEVEWPVGSAIADLWSPTLGVIEIQTRTLGKLRPKLALYLAAGVAVTVIHPIAAEKTIVTWAADRTTVLTTRKSPKRERVEGSFREIGALAEFLLKPGFRLMVVEVRETEHRCDDGLGSWRRQGKSKIDRTLDEKLRETTLTSRHDYEALLPDEWPNPGTTAELSKALRLGLHPTQSLVACLKKLGVLEVVGRQGRAPLLRRSSLQ